MRLVNITENLCLAQEVRTADTFFTRLRGLLGTKELPAGQALVIRPCNSVHTLGMGYPIDVLFVDNNNRIIKTVSDLEPLRASIGWQSEYAVELPAGTVASTGTKAGDYLALEAED